MKTLHQTSILNYAFSLCILSAKIHKWPSEWQHDDLETSSSSLVIISAAQLIQAVWLSCRNTEVDEKLWISEGQTLSPKLGPFLVILFVIFWDGHSHSVDEKEKGLQIKAWDGPTIIVWNLFILCCNRYYFYSHRDPLLHNSWNKIRR